jgi:hypothetical protein
MLSLDVPRTSQDCRIQRRLFIQTALHSVSQKKKSRESTPSKFKFHQMRIESVEAMLCLRAALALLTLVEGKFREERISKQQLWF